MFDNDRFGPFFNILHKKKLISLLFCQTFLIFYGTIAPGDLFFGRHSLFFETAYLPALPQKTQPVIFFIKLLYVSYK
ncbi:MAG: hypothetical protein CBB68_04635 [Rhodospirillaceae bacterium TMED8]|nr:hypothetical protein [Magnetovibrio sp.]OUT51619.1 MAG: hypothetical protein CBB68_04635 [Rhodospirillaceae bacterium TMED8]